VRGKRSAAATAATVIPAATAAARNATAADEPASPSPGVKSGERTLSGNFRRVAIANPN